MRFPIFNFSLVARAGAGRECISRSGRERDRAEGREEAKDSGEGTRPGPWRRLGLVAQPSLDVNT